MKRFRNHLKLACLAVTGSWLASSTFALAQNNPPPLLPQDQLPAGFVELTDKEVVLSYSVLIFGLVVLLLQVYLLRVVKADAHQITLLFTLTIIIVGGLYLVTIGLSSEQIAPAFSLYGAIVGYLLGRESVRSGNDSIERNRSTDEDK